MKQRFTYRVILRLAMLLIALAGWPAAPLSAQSANLLQNTGFEAGSSGWNLCGLSSIVDRQAASTTAAMVYAGQRALRLTYGEGGCGAAVFDPKAAARQMVSIPANAPAVTISFWYSRVGDPVWPLKISLGEYGYLDQVATENLVGWHLYRLELSADDLARVRGQTLELELAVDFNIQGSTLPSAPVPGFYVDNVRLVAASERTVAAPLPAALRSDGTRPIVYRDYQLGGITRMNRDGSGATLLYTGRANNPQQPVWASRGGRLAVLDDWLTPEERTDPLVNPAQITIVSSMLPNGTGLREVFRTAGKPGYRPAIPTPGNPELPALDVFITALDWSTDDTRLAATICAQNRYQNGSVTDAICWIELFDATTGKSQGKFEPAFRANWGANNRILYEENDNYGTKPDGIYERRQGNPPTEQLLVPGTSSQFDPTGYSDSWPTWSPDAKHFATIRKIDGQHYDQNGNYVFHKAMMLFNRNELVGRMILLVDHGSSPGGLTWSPDGKYLLYHLFQGNTADIWWLEVASGATGRLTNNGSSILPDWRLRCPNPRCSDGMRLFLPLIRR